MTIDRFYTVTGYYDRPLNGLTRYQGVPHAYECQFSEALDDYSDLYWLMPIDEDLFTLSMEQWEIYVRWVKAYRSGQVPLENSPLALPAERPRYDAIKQEIGDRLTVVQARSITRRAKLLPESAVELAGR